MRMDTRRTPELFWMHLEIYTAPQPAAAPMNKERYTSFLPERIITGHITCCTILPASPTAAFLTAESFSMVRETSTAWRHRVAALPPTAPTDAASFSS